MSLQQSSSDENLEFTNMSRARFRRRLTARWYCSISGHTYCFTTTDGTHAPLSGEDIELWVSAMHNGEATLLIPPKGIFIPSTANRDSDGISIRTSSTIPYQRSWRWQRNPSLTDLRSVRMRLHNSITSSSTSRSSVLTGSSGEPGIGYVSGKVVKWVGVQILEAIEPLVISRRRQIISDLIKRLETIPRPDRLQWIFKRRSKISRVVEDLLELSMEGYGGEYQTRAISEGCLLRNLLTECLFERGSEEDTYLNITLIKLFPLRLLSNDIFPLEDFAGHLRETLLQESPENADERLLIAEIAARLCFELAYSQSSPWHSLGYGMLFLIYELPHGSQTLQNLGRSGPLIEDLAKTVFTNSAQMSIPEHTWAINFFAQYSNDVHEYRNNILSATGIPLLVENIKSLYPGIGDTIRREDDILDLSEFFFYISDLDWCIPALMACDVYPTLVNLLVFCHGTQDKEWCTILSNIVTTFRNLARLGGYSGRQVILDATTDELTRILPHIGDSVRMLWGDEVVLDIREEITETWQNQEDPPG